jgi:hypothetical protein
LSSRFSGVKAVGLLFLLVSVSLAGCQNGSTVTPQEEQTFKNPPKEMPEAAKQYMRQHANSPQNAQAPALGTTK